MPSKSKTDRSHLIRISFVASFVLSLIAMSMGSFNFALAATNPQEAVVEPRIAWYGTLESGLKEAEKTKKPILLIAAAPQCVGVPGIW